MCLGWRDILFVALYIHISHSSLDAWSDMHVYNNSLDTSMPGALVDGEGDLQMPCGVRVPVSTKVILCVACCRLHCREHGPRASIAWEAGIDTDGKRLPSRVVLAARQATPVGHAPTCKVQRVNASPFFHRRTHTHARTHTYRERERERRGGSCCKVRHKIRLWCKCLEDLFTARN